MYISAFLWHPYGCAALNIPAGEVKALKQEEQGLEVTPKDTNGLTASAAQPRGMT